jgi:hypothetical protein
MTVVSSNVNQSATAISTLQHGTHKIAASAGNRTRVTTMATLYSTTRPLMPLYYWELFFPDPQVIAIQIQEVIVEEVVPSYSSSLSYAALV